MGSGVAGEGLSIQGRGVIGCGSFKALDGLDAFLARQSIRQRYQCRSIAGTLNNASVAAPTNRACRLDSLRTKRFGTAASWIRAGLGRRMGGGPGNTSGHVGVSSIFLTPRTRRRNFGSSRPCIRVVSARMSFMASCKASLWLKLNLSFGIYIKPILHLSPHAV